MNISKELLEKAKTAKTVKELIEMAKAENVELTSEQAADYFLRINAEDEISDEELHNVAGGGCGGSDTPKKPKFNIGDYVLVNKTWPATVLSYSERSYFGKACYLYTVRYHELYNGADGGTFKEEQLSRG